MKEYFFKNKSMYVVGDIHGEFNIIKSIIKQKNITDSIFLFAGDVGLGFYKFSYYEEILKKINKFLVTKNVYLLFGRGNHDDKSYFENELINFSNIKSIPDYSIIKVNNEWSSGDIITLYIGGGISIDRKYRINSEEIDKFYYKLRHPNASDDDINKNVRKLYWIDEPPFFDIDKLDEIVNNFEKINCIASHTCPSFAYPKDKLGIQEWMKVDSDLEKDIDEERNTMTNIYNFLKDSGVKLDRWVYGHFHKHNDEIIDNVRFTLLDCAQNKLDFTEIG